MKINTRASIIFKNSCITNILIGNDEKVLYIYLFIVYLKTLFQELRLYSDEWEGDTE